MLYNTRQDFEKILSDCKFGDWTFRVRYDLDVSTGNDYPGTRCYLQVRGVSDEATSKGGRYVWGGRKWFLSKYMAHSEVVQTAFMAVMAAVEHETRESFKYRDVAIFGLHWNVDLLVDLANQPSGSLDVRVEYGGVNHG